MKSVLVTGGAGYIGSHVCKALAQAGYLPVSYDNLTYGHEWAVKWGPLEVGDIRDATRLQQVFASYQPEAVMHFAAFAYVGESVGDPAKYYQNNVVGTLSLLDVMHKHGVKRLVFSSTCATYGMPDVLPITETTPQKPVSPYGYSKWMIEQILRDYHHAYGLHSIALRYFNAAGADPDGQIGEVHEPETHLIPLVLQVAKGMRKAITVFGDDYATPDGTCIRDYIHVNDLADAHIKALQVLEAGQETTALNLGTGFGVSVREVIAAVESITGLSIPVVIGKRRDGDPASLIAAGGLAKKMLGWQAKHSGIETCIRDAWKWMNHTPD